MIKLVASDLDGTIIDKNHNIYQGNFKAFEDINKKNINFVICTGKTYPILKDMCPKLGASFGIFGNGNQIVDLRTGKEIYKSLLAIDQVNACIDLAKKENLHIHLYTDTGIVTEKLEYMDLRNFRLQEDKFYESNFEFIITDNIKEYINKNNVDTSKLIITDTKPLDYIKTSILNTLEVSVTTIKKYGKYKDTIINKEYEYLDITPKNIDKNSALEILMNYLNVNQNEILAIGDNLNDLLMVKNSGIGVAVNNAYDELKQVANYTTINPVEKGGFAEAVYKFIEF